MLPPRPSNSHTIPAAARKSGPVQFTANSQSFEAIKTRALAKLEDRMDPSTSKRMPASLLRQSIRTHAEQIAETEGRGLPKPERERLVEEVLAELLGYGPLEELFRDAGVREVMVTGPHAVIARRDQGQWLPTNIRFRDEDHLRSALDKLATHADPLGGMIASLNLFDLKLPNGFRAVGVIPPPALGQPATVAFIRVDAAPVPIPADTVAGPASGRYPMPSTGSGSTATARATPGSPTASPRPGSNLITTPAPRAVPADADPLAKHRNRIMERLTSKLASLGVYDVRRVEVTEFRKVVAAYVSEYVNSENVFLSDADQGRLMLEILTVMHR